MPVMEKPFKVSAGLKDLIGRDLITDDFVAVFELVKNSFDAHAQSVQILFDHDTIAIADDGKGMSANDILNKWLFVAYSAKREGTEDEDYRHKISERNRPFAGAKGVGRFSCDRLGKQLVLITRADNQPVQLVKIDWTRYEGNASREFGDVLVDHSEADALPQSRLPLRGETGTILEISQLRSSWSRANLQKLKRELTKLINPFAVGPPQFQIQVIAPSEERADSADAKYNVNLAPDKEQRLLVNGLVENPILEVLSKRTTTIHVAAIDNGERLESTLEDRGEMVYRIREDNPYTGLTRTGLDAKIYFLNRSAKKTFAHRMGLPSVQFGSILLFRNGFRVYPVGEEYDDFFGLTRRKQQGVRRFLGSRDLIGCVAVKGVDGFDEATSRNDGLIRTPGVMELITCIKDKCIKRLERYVVDISWKDRYDKTVADMSRMKLDANVALVTQLVSRLAATDGVELIEYSSELVRIVDEKSEAFEESLSALELLADRRGDAVLLRQVEDARARIRELQEAEAEAREAERRAEARAEEAGKEAAAAQAKYDEEVKRNRFLIAAASLDEDTILNLHHQIIMHASDVHLGVKRMMGQLRNRSAVRMEDWVDFLERIAYRNSQILTASRFATKGGYKQQSAELVADLGVYVRDYVNTVSSLWAPRGVRVEVHGQVQAQERRFRPIEVGIVIDNLVSNATKAHATQVAFFLTNGRGPAPELCITVADDGRGWPESMEPIDKVFEKGVTTTDGSGLGLFHVKRVVEGLGGTIGASRQPYSEELEGAQVRIRVPA